MGYKYEVFVWMKTKGSGEEYGDYENEPFYQGSSLAKAVIAVWKARKFSGCVTFYLR